MAGVALIIGNGFDIDMGLPSRYSDFIRSKEWQGVVKRVEGFLADSSYSNHSLIAQLKCTAEPTLLCTRYGGLIVPGQHNKSGSRPEPKTLKGYGGSMNIYSIIVDALAQSFKAYCQQMSQYEKIFLELLPKIEH